MKKLICILTTIILALSILACGNNNKLVMATNSDFQPYEFKEGNQVVGIDVEIANAIAKKLGKELQVLDIDFDAIIPSVTTNKADFGLAGLTVTDDRKIQVDFSDPYTTAVQSVIIADNSQINNLDDLKGKTIGVQTGTTGDIYASDDYGDDHVQRFKGGADAVAALLAGKIDAVIIDYEPAKAYVKANQGVKIMESAYAEEEYAIAVKKGNTELLNKINETIKELKESGELQNIVSKYIHE